MDKMKLLIYGYGNPGRQDDGLGNAFIDSMEAWASSLELDNLEIEFDSNYQLNIEDADAISGKDIVIFVDASLEPINDFTFTKVSASDSKIEFTMHAVSTSFILDLCQKMYGNSPETYLLHIKGYEWDFKETLTEQAASNMNNAIAFVKEIVLNPEKIKEAIKLC